jgi:hypothetical protein
MENEILENRVAFSPTTIDEKSVSATSSEYIFLEGDEKSPHIVPSSMD